jgi:hypothetical protein
MSPELCAHCRLPVASHRVEVAGKVFCTSFCARQHPVEDGSSLALEHAKKRMREHVRRKVAP